MAAHVELARPAAVLGDRLPHLRELFGRRVEEPVHVERRQGIVHADTDELAGRPVGEEDLAAARVERHEVGGRLDRPAQPEQLVRGEPRVGAVTPDKGVVIDRAVRAGVRLDRAGDLDPPAVGPLQHDRARPRSDVQAVGVDLRGRGCCRAVCRPKPRRVTAFAYTSAP